MGGAERVFLDLTHLLRNEGVQVDVLLISNKGPLFKCIDARAAKYFLNRKWKFNPFSLLKCASICCNYQIVHVHMRHTYAYVRLAKILSFKKFKIVFHDHYGDISVNPAIPFTLKGFFKPKYYIGVSKRLLNWAVPKLNIDKKKVFLLGNTIIPSTEVIQMNEKLDLVMISNVRPTKNIELAIELANRLGRNITIYGNICPSKYGESILGLVETSPYVKLIQRETNVQRFFKNYSLALHTAHSETGPLVLLEYLAKGLPFLAHATGEVAEVLKDEIPECFINSLEVTKWEERIKYLEDAAPSSEKLKSLFNKYFGPRQYVEKCLDIYQKVLA